MRPVRARWGQGAGLSGDGGGLPLRNPTPPKEPSTVGAYGGPYVPGSCFRPDAADIRPMSTVTTATGTPTGSTAGGRWVSVCQAVAELGLSERSIRRAIASGRLVSVVQDGRRVVRIEGEPDGPTGGNGGRHPTGGGIVEIKPDPTGGLAGGELAIMRAVDLAIDRTTEQLRGDLLRARRSAAWGWGLTAAAGILAAVGAVLAVRAIEQARGQAGAADGLRAVLADSLTRERQRADDLADQLRQRTARQQADVADWLAGFTSPVP